MHRPRLAGEARPCPRPGTAPSPVPELTAVSGSEAPIPVTAYSKNDIKNVSDKYMSARSKCNEKNKTALGLSPII